MKREQSPTEMQGRNKHREQRRRDGANTVNGGAGTEQIP